MVTTVTLNDGIEIPQIGFGVFQIPLEETDSAVTTALAVTTRRRWVAGSPVGGSWVARR